MPPSVPSSLSPGPPGRPFVAAVAPLASPSPRQAAAMELLGSLAPPPTRAARSAYRVSAFPADVTGAAAARGAAGVVGSASAAAVTGAAAAGVSRRGWRDGYRDGYRDAVRAVEAMGDDEEEEEEDEEEAEEDAEEGGRTTDTTEAPDNATKRTVHFLRLMGTELDGLMRRMRRGGSGSGAVAARHGGTSP